MASAKFNNQQKGPFQSENRKTTLHPLYLSFIYENPILILGRASPVLAAANAKPQVKATHKTLIAQGNQNR